MAGPSDGAQIFGSEQAGWDAVTDQMAQQAAGRGLAALQAMNQNPMMMQPGQPPGAGPMPTQPTAPPMGGAPGMGPPPPQAQPQPQGANARLMGPGTAAYNPQPSAPPGSFAGRFPQTGQGTLPNPGQAQAPPGAMPPPPPPQQPPQQQMPPMPQGGMPGGPGAYSLQQIVQAVQKANPGAPPNVLMKAVSGLVPLMRPSDQEYFRMMALQQKQQALDQGEGRLGVQQANTNIRATESGQNPPFPEGRGGSQGQQGGASPATSPADKIADDIADGKQAPLFGGWGGVGVPQKLAPAVETALANRHPDFNRAQAALQWQSESKLAQTMMGPQQVRFRQLANSVKPFLDDVGDLTKQMNQSGMNRLNDAQLQYWSTVRGNTPQGQLATRYLTALAGIRGELAQLENGGYAPHDASWQTAYQQIDQARGVQAQLAALSEIKKIINYRIQGMDSVAPGMAPGQSNPYAPGSSQKPGEAAAKAPALPDKAKNQLKKGQMTTFGNGQIWTLGDDGEPQRVQ